MGLDFVCAQNVQHFNPARFKVIRDKRAMATPPDCFCAHDRDRAGSDGFPAVTLISTPNAFGVAPCKGKKAFYAFLELLRLHVIGVPAERRIAPRSVARVWLGFSFAAQLREMFVTDSVPVQRFRQRVLVELRIPPRPWPRTHIGKHLDLVFLE